MVNRDEFIEQNRKERLNFISFVAKKIRLSNFSDELRKEHANFINSQFEMSEQFYFKLGQKKNGVAKIMKLTGLSENQVKRFLNIL